MDDGKYGQVKKDEAPKVVAPQSVAKVGKKLPVVVVKKKKALKSFAARTGVIRSATYNIASSNPGSQFGSSLDGISKSTNQLSKRTLNVVSTASSASTAVAAAAAITHPNRNLDERGVDHYDDENDGLFASHDALVQQFMLDNDDVSMTDTAMALQSILRGGNGCLEIPLLPPTGCASAHTNTNMIRGVLECQLRDFFASSDTGGANPDIGSSGTSSTPTVLPPIEKELDQLLHSKYIVKLESSIALDSSNSTSKTASRAAKTLPVAVVVPLTVYVLTSDYIMAVERATEATVADDTAVSGRGGIPRPIVDWLIRHLTATTNGTSSSSKIRHVDLIQAWKQNPPTLTSLKPAGVRTPSIGTSETAAEHWIRTLQRDCQVLQSASLDHAIYQPWLPGWGRVIVPAFQKAVLDIVVYLKQAQSIQKQSSKERSLASIVQRMRHCPISVPTILLPWLVQQGRVIRVERPSGPFVRLVTV